MVKNPPFSSSLASGRKDKKRKHATVSSPGLSGKTDGKKDGSRMQLDDILSSLTAGTVSSSDREKGREKKETEKPLKKKPKKEVNGKEVSALDLLLGVGSSSKEDKPSRKEKSFEGTVSSQARDATIRHKKDKTKVEASDDHVKVVDRKSKKKDPDLTRKEQRDVSSIAPSTLQPRAPTVMKPSKTSQHSSLHRTESPSGERHTSPPVTSTHTIKDSTTSSHRPKPISSESSTSTSTPLHSIPSTSSSNTTASHDRAFQILKTFKLHLRQLTTVLSSLSTELALIDRIWYKNASQFKSALWWGGFNSVRRCLHRILLPSHDQAASLAHSLVVDLTSLYAGLGGQQFSVTTTASSSTFPPIPKFTSRPTHTTLQTYLSSPASLSHLENTIQQLEALQANLLALNTKCTTAGRALLLHLNTPPAPTFAPLVTALIALLGGVHDVLQSVVGRKHDAAETDNGEKEAEMGAVEQLLSLLRALAQESTG